jgi:two-component system probable response regulator PhcQ
MNATVLLVDDDVHLLDGMCRALHKEPYDIVRAGSAEEALELMRTRPVDVVVSDEEMPGMSGTVFLRHVRDQYPDTVRFILTGKATVPIAIEAINNGGITRFFTKPCDTAEVAVSIRQGLQQRELLLAARKLLQKGRQQSMLIEQLEKSYPSITKVDRDDDGAIPVADWNGDIDQLMQEICTHLDEGK